MIINLSNGKEIILHDWHGFRNMHHHTMITHTLIESWMCNFDWIFKTLQYPPRKHVQNLIYIRIITSENPEWPMKYKSRYRCSTNGPNEIQFNQHLRAKFCFENRSIIKILKQILGRDAQVDKFWYRRNGCPNFAKSSLHSSP